MIKTRKTLFGNIRIESNITELGELEEEGLKYLDKGHEIKKGIFINFRGNYCLIFSSQTTPNSDHLQFKKRIANMRKDKMEMNILDTIKYELLDLKGLLEIKILKIPKQKREPIRKRIYRLEQIIKTLNQLNSINLN